MCTFSGGVYLAYTAIQEPCYACLLPTTLSNEQDKQQDTNHTCRCSERVEPW